MKVAFDSRPAKDPRGVGRYARSLLEALRRADLGEIVETHDPKRCDVFHSPWLDGTPLRCPVPMVATLHDLVPLKRPGEYLRFGLRFKLRYLAVQRAARVIVPTQTVADDAIAALRIPARRIAVIPEAPARVFWRRSAREVAAVRERYELPERYLLWVGGLRTPDPRKRVAALARARRTLPLVLAGPTSRWARELPDVLLTGAVDDDELAAIYTGAHALVFPSDDEGFGLPPVEALACGTPVAACDVPALREVLGGLVTLSDIDDLDQLVSVAESLTRPAPGPPAWTWSEAASATWATYEEAISAARARRPPAIAHSGARRPNGGDFSGLA
ncbi:MAG TPA: glycosyltransferase family 1 protein [Solirubrobacteraceae bacterium]